MEKDREKDTVRRNLVDICSCVSEPDIVKFASQLSQGGLISDAGYQAAITNVSGTPPTNKIAHLVSEVMNKVSKSPENFFKFVSILESRDKKLAETMKSDYSSGSCLKEGLVGPGRPGKPHATNVTHNSLVLSWEKPQYGADSVQSYTITYRARNDPPGRWITQSVTQTSQSQLEHAELTHLAAETVYHFKVRADNETEVSGPYSETSDTVETRSLVHLPMAGPSEPSSIKTRDSVRLADKMIPSCKSSEIPLGGMKVYLLPTHETMRKSGILKFTVWQSQQHAAHKVLMLIGTTGAGKTTMITAIANYIMGVDWKDKYRFKLISEETAHDQAPSITTYTFHKDEGSPLPYTLTVIDTPGFVNTEARVEQNKKIVTQIKELLYLRGHEGIDHLDGIGFITQAPMVQLTRTQQYVFESVLSVFGKNVADNIFLLVTFADAKQPPVLDAVKAAGVPFGGYFKLDNSAFCANSGSSENLDENEWRKGRKRLEEFFNHFSEARAQSLQQSREVLQEREQLEIMLQDLQSQIRARLAKINELQQERQLLQDSNADVNAYKDFTYQVEVIKHRKVDLPAGQSATICLQCNHSCHYPCPCYKDGEKFNCTAMNNPGSLDATCNECANQCSWKDHVNRPYRVEQYIELETRISDELKARYELAIARKGQTEATIEKMEEEWKEMDQEILQKTEEAKQSLLRLQEIALKPPADHFTKYMDTLIKSEQQETHACLNECNKALQKVQSMLKSIPRF